MEFSNVSKPSIIKVIGVGGGGCNAVNHMYNQGIVGVDFVVCNTDVQALERNNVINKIQLGRTLSDGLGAGNKPEKGKAAAIETLDEIKQMLSEQTKMIFITAGMGGGTGTGAAPVIASVAKEMGILTIGIVTLPFLFEGKVRKIQADQGIEEMKKYVDSLVVVCNEKLRELYGNLGVKEAFTKADDVLNTAARGIAEIITVPGNVNVDFEDVKTVLQNSGVAVMGIGIAEGENRAVNAAEAAMNSDLLNDGNINGAKNILINISSGQNDLKLDELLEINEHIQNKAGKGANLIWGYNIDDSLEDKVSVVLVAAGYEIDNGVIVPFKEATASVGNNPTITITPEGDIKQEKNPLAQVSHQDNIEPVNQITEEKLIINLFETDFENESSLNHSVEKQLNITAKQTEFKISEEKNPDVENSVYPDDHKTARTSDERIQALKDLSTKINKENGLKELESQPAFERKERQLLNVKPSGDNVSEISLTIDENNTLQINKNNSFLHSETD